MLPCISSEQITDDVEEQKEAHEDWLPSLSLIFLPHLDILHDLQNIILLNRLMLTCNLFVLYEKEAKPC